MMAVQHAGRLTIFQAAAVDDARLGHAAFRVLACLGTYSDERGWCWPRQQTLAERLRISQQAVSKSLNQLRDLGYIEIHQQTDARGMRAGSRYRLRLDFFPPHAGDMPPQPDVVTQQREVVPATTSEVVPVTTSEVVSATTSEVVTLTSHRERPKKNDPSEKVVRAVRATLASYQPSAEFVCWMRERLPQHDLAELVEQWRDWHTSHGTAIKDFDASLRTWVRKERPGGISPGRASPNGHHPISNEQAKFERSVAALRGVGGQYAAVDVPGEHGEALRRLQR